MQRAAEEYEWDVVHSSAGSLQVQVLGIEQDNELCNGVGGSERGESVSLLYNGRLLLWQTTAALVVLRLLLYEYTFNG